MRIFAAKKSMNGCTMGMIHIILVAASMSYHVFMRPDRAYIKMVRYGVQALFLLLTVHIGYRFFAFLQHFTTPGNPFVERPHAVDAFLPIAGFMSFKYALFTGIVEPFHPAGLVMFTAIVAVSVLVKKGFCGWICPVGTLSQYVWMAGERIFGRNFRMERFTDGSFRSLKYILMAFFLLFIGFAMAPNMMLLFFISDYYMIADVKTMLFFTNISTLSLWVIGVIGILSLLYKNVWCRYLCPYGALLGLLSRWSPARIERTEQACTHCGACSRNCPSLIDVEKQEAIRSAECFGCLTCVASCPAPGALDVTITSGRRRSILHPALFPVVLLGIFYLIIGAAMMLGIWRSQIPYEEYVRVLSGM
ncbi:MAG TPA: 4Fe-4S binding protein [Nitrospiraceae bacterium]|nr:4Fe-4S binding protein [Nitrospiraceae bacterium]